MPHPVSYFHPTKTISCYSSHPFPLDAFSSISSMLTPLFFSYSQHPLNSLNSWYSYRPSFHEIIASLLNAFLTLSLTCYSSLSLSLFSSLSFVRGILDNLLFSYSHLLPCCCMPRMFISLALCYPAVLSSFSYALSEDLLIIISVDLSNQKDGKINSVCLLYIYNLRPGSFIRERSSMP